MAAFRKKVASWLTVAFAVACAFALLGGGIAFADDTDLGAPAHEKTLTPNKGADEEFDGTYTLTLDVTGKSKAATEKTRANIIVVFDVSSSMDNKVDSMSGRPTRLAVAKDAVQDLTNALMAQNTSENPDAVEMALITFSGSATQVQLGGSDWTTNASTFNNVIEGLNTNKGTNWEAALKLANQIEGDGDPTYIVFVSDGNPSTHDGYNGNLAEREEHYTAAKDDAKAIVDAGKPFYGIGVFGTVDKLKGLVATAYSVNEPPAGKYFSASDGSALNAAFSAITNDIKKDFSYTSVTITDTMTDLVVTGIDDASDFTYKKNGQSWTPSSEGANEASFDGDTVTWSLGDRFKLEDGATYSVSFTVAPNQKAFDTVAGLTNGTLEWDAQKYPNVVKNSDGTYSVRSNASAKLAYKQVDTVNGNETVGQTQYADYNYPAMSIPLSKLKIKKVWSGVEEGYVLPEQIQVKVNQDGKSYKTVTLNAASNWSASLVVPAGPEGHTYAIEEITSLGDGWSTTYDTKGPVPFKSLTEPLSASFTVTNARSVADVTLSKTVGGNMADMDKKFTFNVLIKNASGKTFLPEGFTAKTDGSFDVVLAHGQKAVFKDVPAGYTITVTENSEGYLTYINDELDTDGAYEKTVVGTDAITIAYENRLDAEIDTGLLLENAPYLLVLIGAGIVGTACLVAFVIRKKRFED